MDTKPLAPRVSIVVPTFNEEKVIQETIEQLYGFLSGHLSYDWEIIVADNGSQDQTVAHLKELSQKYPQLRWFHIDQAGKGGAIKKAIVESQANLVCFMDADLSTDLNMLPPLLDALDNGYDMAIGSRLLKDSQVERSFKREFLSRGFNYLERFLLRTRFSDAHCGFKAFNREAVLDILPRIKDNGWFFDTELLVYSRKKKLKVEELPVRWKERKESKEWVFGAIFRYSSNLLKLRWRLFREGFRRQG